MTEHLLAMELGPVVEIIAAARKTRDMFFGSWMLSEIAKAAAKAAAETCANSSKSKACEPHEYLIVPAPNCIEKLDERDYTMGDEIFVRVPQDIEPRDVAKAARIAAHDRWKELAGEAKANTPSTQIAADNWNAQVVTADELFEEHPDIAGDVVEVYAAWVPLIENEPYDGVLQRLKRLLVGRNATRNFPPAKGDDAGRQKSSLDGRRASVLPNRDRNHPLQSSSLRLNRGEQLDALGVVKRRGSTKRNGEDGDHRLNYPSTARLAADPWIRRACRIASEEWKKLVEECKKLANRKADDGSNDPVLGRVTTEEDGRFPTYPHYKDFPFEGAILYENRHREFLFEAADPKPDTSDRLKDLKPALKNVCEKVGSGPGSYYAILVADGDNVGDALRQCEDPAKHREFSQALSAFAGKVREIVADHQGALVFAAGEDITAFLPLDQVIGCAEELRTTFEKDLKKFSAPDPPMTLSVGIAIGHFMDALEETHAAARKMEARAKEGEKKKKKKKKNALAVQYRSRGGAPIEFRRSWDDDPKAMVGKWQAHLKKNELPDKVAYDMRRLADEYRDWPDEDSKKKAMRADLKRLLSKKRKTAGDAMSGELTKINDPNDVIQLANMIIISRQILADGKQREVETDDEHPREESTETD